MAETYDVVLASAYENAQVQLDTCDLLSIGEKLLLDFESVANIRNNISTYGVDNLSRDLIVSSLGLSTTVKKEDVSFAVEGIMSDIVDAIKSFFQKILDLFNRMLNFIGNLFVSTSAKCKTKPSGEITPEQELKLKEIGDKVKVFSFTDIDNTCKTIKGVLDACEFRTPTASQTNIDFEVVVLNTQKIPASSKNDLGIDAQGNLSRPEIYDAKKPIVEANWTIHNFYSSNQANQALDKIGAMVDASKIVYNKLIQLEPKLLLTLSKVKNNQKVHELVSKALSHCRLVFKVLQRCNSILSALLTSMTLLANTINKINSKDKGK